MGSWERGEVSLDECVKLRSVNEHWIGRKSKANLDKWAVREMSVLKYGFEIKLSRDRICTLVVLAITLGEWEKFWIILW